MEEPMTENFSDLIESKIDDVQEKIKNINILILSPDYHKERTAKALQQAVQEIDPNTDEQQVTQSLLSIINQMPGFVATGLSENLRLIATFKQELVVWLSVRAEWEAFQTEQTERKDQEAAHLLQQKKREEIVLEKVAEGKIEEKGKKKRTPGKRPKIDREIGVHPGPTTSEIRKAKAKLSKSGS